MIVRRALGILVVPVAIILTGPSAIAVNSGMYADATVSGSIPYEIITQQADEDWTFGTSNLAGGPLPDTVLHVQDFGTGGFITGNDDNGDGGLNSLIFVPRTGAARSLAVVVRAWDTPRYGTCTLTATSSNGANLSWNLSFGGTRFSVGGLLAGTHVTTTEVMGGATDTVVVAAAGDGAVAIGFDDDNGTGLMSWMHLADDCNDCSVIVGNFSSTGSAQTNLVWDGDADTTDYDCDGLGMTLEQNVLGTVWDNVPRGCGPPSDTRGTDTDQDGINDGAEFLGVETASGPVKFPTWGADWNSQDIFYEFDWPKCISSDTSKCPVGADSGQMGAKIPSDDDFNAQVIVPLQNLFNQGKRIHLSIGRSNTNPAYAGLWGDWGGAERLDTADPDGCGVEGASSWLAYFFHHGVSFPREAKGGAYIGSTCWAPGPFLTTNVNNTVIIAHESGHGFGLWHTGRPFKDAINYKPNYVSVMNYLYEYSPNTIRFSHGTFPVQVLNPTSLNERLGLGAPPADTSSWEYQAWSDALHKLQSNSCPTMDGNKIPILYGDGKCVNIDGNAGAGIPIGAVDWNRDGVYAAQGTTVQGAVQGAGYFVRDFVSQWTGSAKLKDPALTWVNAGGTVGNQLWVFGRDATNRLVYQRLSSLSRCNGPFTSFDPGQLDCAGFGNPGTTVLFSDATGQKVLAVAPGVAEYNPGVQSGQTSGVMVVYQKTTGVISSELITTNTVQGLVNYGGEVALPSNFVATGDITALPTAPGDLRVWAPRGSGSNARLREWRYYLGTRTWTDQGDQVWDSGSPIVPQYGIGATVGYQDGSTTSAVYAAIPVYPYGLVEFARKGSSGWSKVTFTCPKGSFGCVGGTASSWAGIGGAGRPSDPTPGTQPMAEARPGLAYQRVPGQAVSVGRFYMAINQGTSCSEPFGTPWSDPAVTNPPDPVGCQSRLIMTEGNLATGTPSSRRLRWTTPAVWIADKFAVGGISLLNDATRDGNLRAAFTDKGGTGFFAPLADGITNADHHDFNDLPYLIGAMRASLCLDGGSWPQPGQAHGKCAPLPPNLP